MMMPVWVNKLEVRDADPDGPRRSWKPNRLWKMTPPHQRSPGTASRISRRRASPERMYRDQEHQQQDGGEDPHQAAGLLVVLELACPLQGEPGGNWTFSR